MSEDTLAKKLLEMSLHEYYVDEPWEITRVNGGWIYTHLSTPYHSIFVPLHNEFLNKES